MAKNLPYLSTPGSVKTALEKIRSAATPELFTKDFLNTKLQIKGGTGSSILAYLKKIGLVASDGKPTDLYKRFRNPTSGGAAIAEAMKIGYRDLLEVNEYFYELSDKDLLALIVQVTGAEADSAVAKYTLYTFKQLKAYADFEPIEDQENGKQEMLPGSMQMQLPPQVPPPSDQSKVGLNLSYTINLNLPATTDQAVFNAIFKSLKEHLLSHGE